MSVKLHANGDIVADANPLPVKTTGAAATATSPGYSEYRRTALDETKQSIKAAAGNVYGFTFINPNTVPVYVKLYDALVADVTVGVTTPKKVIPVPAGDGASPGIALALADGNPATAFATAIVIAAVTGLADASAGALTTDIHAEVVYK